MREKEYRIEIKLGKCCMHCLRSRLEWLEEGTPYLFCECLMQAVPSHAICKRFNKDLSHRPDYKLRHYDVKSETHANATIGEVVIIKEWE